MNNGELKWYIATTIIGNEEIVYKNIEDKIRAYGLTDLVKEIKLLKANEITIEIFDNKTNPPPKLMRNTKTITWESLPGNRYKKTKIKEINRFPGYIYIQMVMTQEAWYAIRNTYGITGFVGSSGKGAQPIPMSDQDVEALFDPTLNKDIIIDKSGTLSEEDIKKLSISETEPTEQIEENKKSGEIEFLAPIPNIIGVNNRPFVVDNDGFYDSKANEKQDEHDIEKEAFLNKVDSIDKTRDLYLNDHQEVQIESKDKATSDYSLRIGTFVKIISGEMKDTVGHIIAIDNENNKVTLEIEILGRKNTIDVLINEVSTENIN